MISGIIRRFDDLGRIVIPKEIRRARGWEEGAYSLRIEPEIAGT